MPLNTKAECVDSLVQYLERGAAWRRTLAVKFQDPRNTKAAETLDKLAIDAVGLTDSQWGDLWKSPGKLGGFLLAGRSDHRSNPGMGTKTTFVCDCCLRESDNNFGWARVSVNGASDGRQLTPDDNRDLCEICWSPLQTLMKKVEERNSASKA
jgi:hypothetical protein